MNHNHNHNYNLMGFDTIEINLVDNDRHDRQTVVTHEDVHSDCSLLPESLQIYTITDK